MLNKQGATRRGATSNKQIVARGVATKGMAISSKEQQEEQQHQASKEQQ
jgi:hypothetical protein